MENIESGQQVRWLYACDGSGVELSVAATVVYLVSDDMVRVWVQEPSADVLSCIRFGSTVWETVHNVVYDPTRVTFTVDRRSLVPTHQWARVASFGWLD